MALESGAQNTALDERTFLTYKERQFELLDKLLGSNFFQQNINDDEVDQFPQLIITGNNSFGKENQGGSIVRNDSIQRSYGDQGFLRRDKKVQVIKLSRYIKNDLSGMREESINVEKYLNEARREDQHPIGVLELEKLIKTRSDKTYYDPKMIEENYEEVKSFLLDLTKDGHVNAEDLSSAQVNKLLDACSFCMNGVHYLQKFKKSKNMIHPIDLLYVLEHIKSSDQ